MWVDRAVANAHHAGYAASGAALAPRTAIDRLVRSTLLAVNAAAAIADVPSRRWLKNNHDQLPLRTRLDTNAAMYARRSRCWPRRSSSSSVAADVTTISAYRIGHTIGNAWRGG